MTTDRSRQGAGRLTTAAAQERAELIRIMVRNGLTRAQMADIIGINQPSLSVFMSRHGIIESRVLADA